MSFVNCNCCGKRMAITKQRLRDRDTHHCSRDCNNRAKWPENYDKKLTQDRLRELVRYDPETGLFTYLKYRSGQAGVGDICKTKDGLGYLYMEIGKKKYFLHRLAFLYMNAEMPIENVDHINHISSDNRWANLELKPQLYNARNRRMAKNNTSGVSGVCWSSAHNKWLAAIGGGNVKIKLGQFDSFFDAVCVRKSAELRLNYHPNHGSM